MGQRTIRVNELILREINELLHTYYQSETVLITVFEVQVTPDLRHAQVYYSVIGDAREIERARDFFNRRNTTIRRQIGKKVVLKYLPHLKFIYNSSMERGAQVLSLLDEIEETEDEQEQ